MRGCGCTSEAHDAKIQRFGPGHCAGFCFRTPPELPLQKCRSPAELVSELLPLNADLLPTSPRTVVPNSSPLNPLPRCRRAALWAAYCAVEIVDRNATGEVGRGADLSCSLLPVIASGHVALTGRWGALPRHSPLRALPLPLSPQIGLMLLQRFCGPERDRRAWRTGEVKQNFQSDGRVSVFGSTHEICRAPELSGCLCQAHCSCLARFP